MSGLLKASTRESTDTVFDDDDDPSSASCSAIISRRFPKGKISTSYPENENDAASSSSEKLNIDGINLEEIKEFAKSFKMKRLSLGLTQTQVGQALSMTEGPAYSQSAICRCEWF